MIPPSFVALYGLLHSVLRIGSIGLQLFSAVLGLAQRMAQGSKGLLPGSAGVKARTRWWGDPRARE
jgi:hypothetical protein